MRRGRVVGVMGEELAGRRSFLIWLMMSWGRESGVASAPVGGGDLGQGGALVEAGAVEAGGELVGVDAPLGVEAVGDDGGQDLAGDLADTLVGVGSQLVAQGVYDDTDLAVGELR